MEKPAGTIGDNDQDRGSGDEHVRSRRGPRRFMFPSGAQPLAGYTIKRGIGAGGFGEVYYATSEAGKEVALKYVQRNLEIELRGVRQCLNLKHPNLVALYDIRQDDTGNSWVVMEYISGESLRDVIDRNPNGMPHDQVAFWFSGIAAGVQYLHDHGIVHRDLKPGNIFVDGNIVKIGDYGLSKFISCSRRSGHTESVGTFHYMAPEIGQGRYGKEIDIYALGIVLHEMISGRVPFEGESSQEIIMKHLTARPSLQDLPAPYRHVIGRALAKRPEQRFPSVGKMMMELGMASATPGNYVPSEPLPADVPADVPADAGGVVVTTDSGRPVDFVDESIPIEIVNAEARLMHPMGTASEHPATPPLADRQPPRQPTPGDPRSRSVPGSYFPEPVKWILLTALVILIVTRAQLLLPIALTLGTVYGFYLLFSVILDLTFGAPEDEAEAAGSNAPAAGSQRLTRRERRAIERSEQEELRHALSRKTLLTKLWEWNGAAIVAVVVSAILTFVMTVVGSQTPIRQHADWVPLFTWMLVPSVLGSWSLLALGKCWEDDDSDPSMRRFIQGLVGLGVGAATGWFGHLLQVDPTYILSMDPLTAGYLPELLYAKIGSPTPYAFALYFGSLFLVLRWWRRTDPLRDHRLGLWSTITAPIAAVLLCLVFPIPRGFMIATCMTIATQLAAPWLTDKKRWELAQRQAEDSAHPASEDLGTRP